jgi:hypothetical protein
MNAEQILEKAEEIYNRYQGVTRQDLWWIAETLRWETRCQVDKIGLKDDGTLEIRLLVLPEAFPPDSGATGPVALSIWWLPSSRPHWWQRVKSALFGHE